MSTRRRTGEFLAPRVICVPDSSHRQFGAPAQRSKQAPKRRAYTIDLSQSQVIVTLIQEGFISRRYPIHRVEVKTFTGKIEVSEKDETQVAVDVEAESKSLTNIDEGMSEFERKEFHSVINNLVLE